MVQSERNKATPEDMVSDLMQYVQMETSQFPMHK